MLGKKEEKYSYKSYIQSFNLRKMLAKLKLQSGFLGSIKGTSDLITLSAPFSFVLLPCASFSFLLPYKALISQIVIIN